MNKYNIIGIDLAKTKFHIAALDINNKVVMKKSITREDFTNKLSNMFAPNQKFAFEACGGCHYIGQLLMERGHQVIALKPQDVKPYAKSRQKNDINDAIAICKAALDPELKKVQLKSEAEQEVAYLHKSRQNKEKEFRSFEITKNNCLVQLIFICKNQQRFHHCSNVKQTSILS